MAEGYARALKGDLIDAYSAGIVAHGQNPSAVRVMAEHGVDITAQESKTLQSLLDAGHTFDVVFTVCGHADDNCPVFPGKTKVIHRGFDDPPKLAKDAKSEEEVLNHYRRVRDEIRAWIECFAVRKGVFRVKEYPVFTRPKRYLETREPNRWQTRVKKAFERQAILNLLRGLDLQNGLLDVPCGPGRLFPIWSDLNVPVFAVDYSEEFVAFAQDAHSKTVGRGWVAQGDVFSLERIPQLAGAPPPSLIASVRFLYYFPQEKRKVLLRHLVRVGSPYILLQYLIENSVRDRMRSLRFWENAKDRRTTVRGKHLQKRRISHDAMIDELESEGLKVLKTAPASPFSRRVFALCRVA